jgi:hypothetical protein
MAVIEFQLSVPKFLAAQKVAIQSQQICTPPWIDVGPVQVVIDRIEFGDNSIRNNVPQSQVVFYPYFDEVREVDVPGVMVQMAQPVTVWVTTRGELEANLNGPPAIVVPLTITVLMQLNYRVVEQVPYISISYSNYEIGPLPLLPAGFDPKNTPLPIVAADIVQSFGDLLKRLIPSFNIPVDVTQMLPLTPAKNVIFNAGVAVDTQSQRLLLRLAMGASAENADIPWIDFYRGVTEDRLRGADWGVYFDGVYLSTLINTLVWQAIGDALPDQVQLFIGTNYTNAGGRAVFNNDILGIYRLPDPFGRLEANPHIPIEVSVQNTSVISGILTVDAGIPDIEELVDSIVPLWVKIFLPFLGPVLGVASATAAAVISGLIDSNLPPECKRTAPNNLRCTKRVQLPSLGDNLWIRLTGLLALDDGISLIGSIDSRAMTLGQLSMFPKDFEFRRPEFSCGGAGTELVALVLSAPESLKLLYAQITVIYSGTVPCYLCSVTPINDGMGVFPASAIQADSATTALTITIAPPIPPDKYYIYANYPCDLLVKTTAGARVIRIPPPPKLTQKDINKLADDMLEALANCEKLVDPSLKFFGDYNPKWSVDPGIEGDYLHYWEVEVNGLHVDETVRLLDASHQELVEGRSRSGATVLLSGLLSPSAGGEIFVLPEANAARLQIHESGESLPQLSSNLSEPRRPRSGIGVKQQLLKRLGSIALQQQCRTLQLTSFGGRRCVLVVETDRAQVFNVDNPRMPILVATWLEEGVKGVLSLPTGFLLFGDSGLRLLRRDSSAAILPATCTAEGMIDAVATGGLIYGLTQDGISAFSPNLCRLGFLPSQSHRSIISCEGRVIVGGPNGIALLDASGPQKLHLASTHEHAKVTRLSRPQGLGNGEFLALNGDGSGAVLKVENEELLVVAKFPHVPWFADTLRCGDQMYRLGARRMSLEVLSMVSTKLL